MGQSHASGHLQLKGPRGRRAWYALWRDANGRHQKRLGPAHAKDSGRRTPRGAVVWHAGDGPKPSPAHLTPRDAADALAVLLAAAPVIADGPMPTFAEAAAEWLRHAEHERACKVATLTSYRSMVRQLQPVFGETRLDEITPRAIERWRSGELARGSSACTLNKITLLMGGVYRRADRLWDVGINPLRKVDKLRERPYDDLEFYDPPEIWALVRAAASEQDATIFVLLAFAGLRRGEALALSWRDVDFEREAIRVRANWSHGQLVTTKGDRIRSVPMVPVLAQWLARLGQRPHWTGPDDAVFVGEAGERLDGSALRRRYIKARDRAGLRPLRLHDLRHCFASLAIDHASPVEVQAWAGHRDARTTARYTHYKNRHGEAARLAKAFGPAPGPEVVEEVPSRVMNAS